MLEDSELVAAQGADDPETIIPERIAGKQGRCDGRLSSRWAYVGRPAYRATNSPVLWIAVLAVYRGEPAVLLYEILDSGGNLCSYLWMNRFMSDMGVRMRMYCPTLQVRHHAYAARFVCAPAPALPNCALLSVLRCSQRRQ